MKTSTTQERLVAIMEQRELKQVDILKLCQPYTKEYGIKISKSDLSQYVAGKTEPGNDKIFLLAKALNVSERFLMGWEDEPETKSVSDLLEKYKGVLHPIEKRSFPMLGTVACGKPIMADRQYDSYVLADADINADYCLTAQGDSMINAHIFDGDIVFIKQQDIVDNGEIAAVCIDDEVTLKRVYYYPEDQTLRLEAENPNYRPLSYYGEELDHVHIMGKAVFFQSMVR